jgi:hypothetical protein
MSYYRVQIEELNNGEKRYTPQVTTLSIVGRLFPKVLIQVGEEIITTYERE